MWYLVMSDWGLALLIATLHLFSCDLLYSTLQPEYLPEASGETYLNFPISDRCQETSGETTTKIGTFAVLGELAGIK